NEEVHIILGGSGQFKVDDDVFPVQEGSTVRVATGGVRAIKAGGDGIIYMCIQAKQGSLEQATMDDGVIVEGDVTWP
ncbi:cupin domain-containing protein, partial [Synergistaceae bacterium OttesenSCG-928-D05]|nr:cupin domain-containing protein [Synergistaceae bacterium OttesenSCG-928-D05]